MAFPNPTGDLISFPWVNYEFSYGVSHPSAVNKQEAEQQAFYQQMKQMVTANAHSHTDYQDFWAARQLQNAAQENQIQKQKYQEQLQQAQEMSLAQLRQKTVEELEPTPKEPSKYQEYDRYAIDRG